MLRGRAGDACNCDGRDLTLVGKVPALDIDRPVLSGIESGLEVQQRIGIDRQSVGVVGIIMARRPFDIGTGIEAARMLVEQFGAQIMLRHAGRSEEHTSELQSLMRISYAVFCLKKKKQT